MRTFIAAVILTITLTAVCGEEARAYDQCSGTYKTYTSEMKKPIKIKESKLTSLRYVKKICKISATFITEDCTVYELDGDNGVLSIDADGNKVCVLVKDDELYGRLFIEIDRGRTVTYNWHDRMCSTNFKATEEEMIYFNLKSFEVLAAFVDKFILDTTTTN